MNRRSKNIFVKVLQSFGIVMILLSLWMLPRQDPGSAEKIITMVNIGIGALLVLIGLYHSFKERYDK